MAIHPVQRPRLPKFLMLVGATKVMKVAREVEAAKEVEVTREATATKRTKINRS